MVPQVPRYLSHPYIGLAITSLKKIIFSSSDVAMLQTAFYFSDLEPMKISGCQALTYMLSTTKYSEINSDLRV
jgi:hypothetical protein